MSISEKGKEKRILTYLSSSVNGRWLIFHESTTKKIIKIIYLKLNVTGAKKL